MSQDSKRKTRAKQQGRVYESLECFRDTKKQRMDRFAIEAFLRRGRMGATTVREHERA